MHLLSDASADRASDPLISLGRGSPPPLALGVTVLCLNALSMKQSILSVLSGLHTSLFKFGFELRSHLILVSVPGPCVGLGIAIAGLCAAARTLGLVFAVNAKDTLPSVLGVRDHEMCPEPHCLHVGR